MQECRPVSTSLESKYQVACDNDNCEKINPKSYQSLNGSLMIRYRKTGQPVVCYADANCGGDATNRKSYTGYVVVLDGSVFSWESKKQATVALNTTEAECMALSLAAKEAVFLRKMLNETQIHFQRRF